MLLRVGIDKGTDGALAPIFDDGSFEFIPISERAASREMATYANTLGRNGMPFSAYLPKSIHQRQLHNDPEFKTFTYGDPTGKRKYLLRLEPDDLLVFYAGLSPFDTNRYSEALYIVGYFAVIRVIDFNPLSKDKIRHYHKRYPNNAHIKRHSDPIDLVLVIGDRKRSRLLDRAILISQRKQDSKGRPYHAVSDEMQQVLGISGSIQRSIPPRFVTNLEAIAHLMHILGI